MCQKWHFKTLGVSKIKMFGSFLHLKALCGVKNPRFFGHADDEAFYKVELMPLAILGDFTQV